MAWIVGLATENEIKLLRGRGWEMEDPPLAVCNALVSQEDDQASDLRPVQVYIDADLFEIMSGKDWDLEPDEVSNSSDVDDYCNRAQVEFSKISPTQGRSKGHG